MHNFQSINQTCLWVPSRQLAAKEMQLRRRHFPNTVTTKNPANQKFYIHFFIDSSNANISLYTLSCPDFNLGQLRLYKMKFTLELSMKK